MKEKTYFFYFAHSLLQNIYISLSILHIYSIKYSFILHFLLFPSPSSSLEPSHRPNTNPKSPTPSHHHQPTIINHHHPTENPNSKSKPHRKSRPLNPIINDSHRLDPQRRWSLRPRPHTKTHGTEGGAGAVQVVTSFAFHVRSILRHRLCF